MKPPLQLFGRPQKHKKWLHVEYLNEKKKKEISADFNILRIFFIRMAD
jgi:hypothetical protein